MSLGASVESHLLLPHHLWKHKPLWGFPLPFLSTEELYSFILFWSLVTFLYPSVLSLLCPFFSPWSSAACSAQGAGCGPVEQHEMPLRILKPNRVKLNCCFPFSQQSLPPLCFPSTSIFSLMFTCMSVLAEKRRAFHGLEKEVGWGCCCPHQQSSFLCVASSKMQVGGFLLYSVSFMYRDAKLLPSVHTELFLCPTVQPIFLLNYAKEVFLLWVQNLLQLVRKSLLSSTKSDLTSCVCSN